MQDQIGAGKDKSIYKVNISALNNYYIPYFGAKSIENITSVELNEFSEWRRKSSVAILQAQQSIPTFAR